MSFVPSIPFSFMIQGSEMQASQSKARDYDDGEKVRD